MTASMAASARTTTRPMSRKIAAGWRSRWASRPIVCSTCIRSIRPTRWWRPGHGKATSRAADAIVTRTEGLAIGVTAADCGPILLVDPDRARDRRGACRLEGRADRHHGIHRGGDGETRRRPQRHGGGDRPPDPPALLRSRRRIRRTFPRGRRRQCRVLHSLGRARAIRCSTSPASSGCGWKMPAC